jgi:hypothetical protein
MATTRSRRRDPNQLSIFDADPPAPRLPEAGRRRRQTAASARSGPTPAERHHADDPIVPRQPERSPRAAHPRPQVNGERRATARRSPDTAPVRMPVLDEEALDTLADLLAPRVLPRPRSGDARADEWLDAKRAAGYIGLSIHALHKLTAARSMPFHQDGPGCKLWFRRDELDTWRAAGGARRWKR